MGRGCIRGQIYEILTNLNFILLDVTQECYGGDDFMMVVMAVVVVVVG